VAVVLSHGHIDHVASVLPVCGAHDVPAWVHPADRYMLGDPEKALGRAIGAQLMGELSVGEPDDLRELTDGETLALAGLEFTVAHAPGHTKGSVTYRLPQNTDIPPVLFSGDLLFAGSVGRSDLPGGDPAELYESLARVCLPLDDSTVVLSGHGPQTTIGRERATNPYLGEAARGHGAGDPAPRRGL
jgi:glyoxylase-like metal-dependent hydrolase (beta-lactamase superfamily II)